MTARIDELLAELTVDEKAAMVAGVDLWHTASVPRLGIPALKVTDGPAGARGERWTGRASASFPCGTALGATWNPELARTVGERIGREARRKGAHVLLAPTVNIHRHPLAGRNFECYSEDPYLTARLAVEYIRGVQSTGVGCSVKHFVANDSEFERMTISSEVDTRTLREISLVPFEAAVLEAGTWSVMAAYNRLHGTYCSEHPLLTEVLKHEWGFDGVIMSDWYGTHSTVPAAQAGLDLEMPGPAQWFGPHLADARRAGDVSEDILDDKVRRMLGLLDRTGGLDTPDFGPELSIDDPEDRVVARWAAAESFVLLHNRDALLPLADDPSSPTAAPAADADMRPVLAVIGPNAAVAMIQGGGSARVSPFPPVAPLNGLRERFGDTFRIEHERGCSSFKQTPVLDTSVLDGPLEITYYPGRECRGEPALIETGDRGWFTFTGPFTPEVPPEFSMRISATLMMPESGTWTFGLVQVGRARLTIDGEVVVDNWEPTGRSEAFMGFASAEVTATVELTAGVRHALEVEYVLAGPSMGALAIGCTPPAPADLFDRAVALAARADVVVCVVGTDGDWETEGNDRASMALPAPQDELVRALAAVNPRTVVVVNAAAPIAMDWADEVGAVMQCWFAGQEWGHALADVISGDVTPSGKLPTTLPVRIEDTPAYTNYPGERGQVRYGEGVFVGYRWYDARRLAPRFCFGHGLSYTTFTLGPPQVSATELRATQLVDGERVRVVVSVRNTGTRRGAEVVQCYVHDVQSSVARPPQELKAFAKVWLDAGATAETTLELDRRAFAFWDVDTDDWVVEPGEFELRIGTSSRAIVHRAVMTVTDD
ncbi:MAG: glycoside hydrolase family 3 protein [Acidimicrobiia bacterium]